MKQKNLFFRSAIALSLMAATALHATNGDTIIGVGAKTRAMGGAGIALSHGAESTLVNPALITAIKETEISFGGTIFMPTIKTEIVGFSPNAGESAADISVIPAVAIASQFSPGFYAGIGMWGTAGMGTDFRDRPDLMKMETTLQLMQFAVPLAYKSGGFSVGVAPILQYGSLDIHYTMPAMMGGANIGSGQAQDFGFGASMGLTYDFGAGFTVGAVYKSEIEMKYGTSLTTATGPFAAMPGFPAIADTLTQPAEIGIGLGYTDGTHSFALDYKRIKWSDASGYKQFGWEDQNIFAMGYEYKQDNWAVRLGYNHASSPVKIFPDTSPGNAALNMFNLLGFPATAEDHYTVGGSYAFNDSFSMDLAMVYSPESKTSSALSAMFGPGAEIKNTHSEFGATIQLNYTF